MQASGKCPECGLDVRTSLEGARIAPEDLARATTGCRWLRGGLVTSVVVQVASWVLVPLGILIGFQAAGGLPGLDAIVQAVVTGNPVQASIPPQAPAAPGPAAPAPAAPAPANMAGIRDVLAVVTTVPQILAILVMVALFVGTWKYTTPWATDAGTERWYSPRRLARGSAAVATGAVVLATVLSMAAGGPMMGPANAAVVALSISGGLMSTLASLATGVLLCSLLLHTRTIARRVRAAKMSRRAGVMGWWVLGIYLVGSCLMVGPFVATVLTLVLLEQSQGVLRAATQRQAARAAAV